jgi:hypothetical protein
MLTSLAIDGDWNLFRPMIHVNLPAGIGGRRSCQVQAIPREAVAQAPLYAALQRHFDLTATGHLFRLGNTTGDTGWLGQLEASPNN